MLDSIQSVKREVRARTPGKRPPYRLSDIQQVIAEIAGLSSVRVQKVELPEGHRALGRYRRHQGFGHDQYNALERNPYILVQCSAFLSPTEFRVVACKEMCQALVDGSDTRADSEEKIERLCSELRLPPNQRAQLGFSRLYTSETLAQFFAWEVLCPVEDRVQIVEQLNGAALDHGAVATEFQVPPAPILTIFDPPYIEATSMLLNGET